jgi:hypothetical protein
MQPPHPYPLPQAGGEGKGEGELPDVNKTAFVFFRILYVFSFARMGDHRGNKSFWFRPMKGLKSLLLIVIVWAAGVVPAMAKEAYLSDFVVTNTRDHLLVYFSVNNCFTPEMNNAIESGIETTFTFFIQLREKRDLIWDKKIADLEVNHSIKYDSLKKIYSVRFSEDNIREVSARNFEEAKKMMAEIVALKVLPMHQLKKGKRYQLQMMAQLDKIRLPFYLHYVLFFVSLWDFETDWYAVDFRY